MTPIDEDRSRTGLDWDRDFAPLLRRRRRWRLLFVVLGVLFVLGCGEITSSQLTTDAGAELDAGGQVDVGPGGAGGAGGGAAGAGGTTQVEIDAGAGGAACLEATAQGFAFGPACDGGACRATCELD